MRVLHCPWTVGGHAAGLAAAERRLGIESATVAFRPSPFGYPSDEVLWADDEHSLTRELKRFRLLARVLRDFDVVHFNFGSTIAPQRIPRDAPAVDAASTIRNRGLRAYSSLFEQLDLPVLARAGKAIFVTFQGDDGRQGDAFPGLPVNGAVEAAPGHYSPASNADKRRRIARFQRWADGIYALNPDLLRVLPERARFVPYAHVDASEWAPGPPAGARERPLVVHAPTNREIKGTRFLLEAVSRLQAEGVGFDFELVEGRTQAEARALYAQADLVVDQLLIGWYGGLAVEAMALERPVVSYVREEDLRFVPEEMRDAIPVVEARPDTIRDVLEELLTTRRGELAELGARGRRYVSLWHDPRRIAEELVEGYETALNARRRSRRA
jgi:glycosyltransferase involved in cell wall biosynthesis